MQTFAEIGYRSPSGRLVYYDYKGTQCSGEGFAKPLHAAPWLEYDRAAHGDQWIMRAGFGNNIGAECDPPLYLSIESGGVLCPMRFDTEYSRSFSFESLEDFAAYIENL